MRIAADLQAGCAERCQTGADAWTEYACLLDSRGGKTPYAPYTVTLVNPPWRTDAPTNLVKLAVGRCLVAVMDASKWTELGLLTDTAELIGSHPRLLRSLRFGDDDYDGQVFGLVPLILNEQTRTQPTTLHTKFPNLTAVSDYIGLPAWLAENDDGMFRRLFDDAGDATMPDGTVLSAVAAAAARLEP